MSTQKKENPKLLSFLTPQTQRISSKSNLSFSSGNDPKYLFENLMKNPIKRALFMEVISQDTPQKRKNLDKKQKFKYESPSALRRRRALEKMELKHDLMNNSVNTPKHSKKIPLECLLRGVVAYVEIINNNEDRSTGVKLLMQAMGADVRNILNKEVTHVVFKDGSFKTYQKAALLKAHLVSILWVEAVRRNQYRVSEKDYPALGSTTPTANISLICQQFQKDYEDILQEELQRNKSIHNLSNVNSNKSYSEDIIDSSQNYDTTSIISVKHNLNSKSSSSPNSLYLDNTSDLASDSESDTYSRKSNAKDVLKCNDKSKGRRSSFGGNMNEKIHCELEDKMNKDNDLNNGYNNSCNSNNSIRNSSNSNKKSLESEEFSSLIISTESHNKSDKQSDTSQKILLYKNITERPNIMKEKSDVNIVDMIVIKSPISSPNKHYFNKEQSDIKNTSRLDKKRRESVNFARKLYNDDDMLNYELNNKVISPNKDNASTSEEFVKNNTKNREKLCNLNSSKTKNHEMSNLTTYCLKSPRNLKNSDLKEPVARRRKSRRFIKSVPKEPLGKKVRNSDDEDILKNDIENRMSCKTKLLSLSKMFHEINSGSEDEFLQISFNTNISDNQKSIEGDKESNSNSQNRNSSNISNESKHASNVKKSFATPRRKSTRLMKNEMNKQSPQKEFKRSIGSYNEGNSDSNINRNSEDSKKEEEAVKDQKSCNVDSTWDINKESPTKKLRSTLDCISKKTTKSQKSSTDINNKIKLTQHGKSVKKASIVCTRFHSTEVQVFQQIVKKLGVFFVEDEVTDKTTHVVAAEARRTVNILRAMARGCWILKSEWLYKSLEADCWLPEEDYELCEFSNAVQKARQERQAFGLDFSMDIFKNCGRIYISKQTNPRCSDLQELVTLCQGTVTTILRNADIIVGEYIENKLCVTIYWIMDGITFYKRRPLKKYLIEPSSSD